MKNFDISRPVPGQILESILDHSEEWEVVLSGTDPVIHHHKSGLDIWSYKSARDVKVYKPSEISESIEFTEEDKDHIFKAIGQIREERRDTKREECKAEVIKMLNVAPSPKLSWKSVEALLAMNLGISGWLILMCVAFVVILTLGVV
jgi:hypothetical protein